MHEWSVHLPIFVDILELLHELAIAVFTVDLLLKFWNLLKVVVSYMTSFILILHDLLIYLLLAHLLFVEHAVLIVLPLLGKGFGVLIRLGKFDVVASLVFYSEIHVLILVHIIVYFIVMKECLLSGAVSHIMAG